MRAWAAVLVATGALAGCPPPQPYFPPPQPIDPGLDGPIASAAGPETRTDRLRRGVDPQRLGKLDDRSLRWVFDGGQIELELYRSGSRLVQIARNRYATPIVLRWQLGELDNLDPRSPTLGVVVLPPAPAPNGIGPTVILAELDQIDLSRRYHRELFTEFRWGDPRARPADYVYRLPYGPGLTFAVLQGWHGQFSHRGSNEFAVDFDCPVATSVLAARPGVVVAANAAAQGSGVTPEWLDYRRTNFVLIQHDDGTLGEYMHLSPSGIEVKPGQRVDRGTTLALSGNTGFSSTPHLHFQVLTASADGGSARSFPFRFAVSPRRVEEPVQGRHYASWEQAPPSP